MGERCGVELHARVAPRQATNALKEGTASQPVASKDPVVRKRVAAADPSWLRGNELLLLDHTGYAQRCVGLCARVAQLMQMFGLHAPQLNGFVRRGEHHVRIRHPLHPLHLTRSHCTLRGRDPGETESSPLSP